MQVSNSCRGHPGYPAFEPYEIKTMRRISRLGWYRGRFGEIRLAALLLPVAVYMAWHNQYGYGVYRRNVLFSCLSLSFILCTLRTFFFSICHLHATRRFKQDEQRQLTNRLYPLYTHEADKL